MFRVIRNNILMLSILFFILYEKVFFTFVYSSAEMKLVDDFLSLTAILLILLYMLSRLKIRYAILNSPLMYFLLAFFVSAVVNMVSLDIVLVQLRSYLLMISLYYLIVFKEVANRDLFKIIKIIFIFSIPIIASAYIEHYTGHNLMIEFDRYGVEFIEKDIHRVYTLIGNPIDYANYIALISIIWVSSLLSKYKQFNFSKFSSVVVLLLIIVSLFFANSRGVIIALTGTILFASLYLNLISKARVLVYMLLAIVFLIVFEINFISRLSQFNLETLENDMYRVHFLIKSIEIFLNNPFFGVGPGKFGGWVSINYSESYVYAMYAFNTDRISSIDMFFPHLIVELGVFGFLAYLMFFIKPFLYYLKILRGQCNKSVFFFSLIPVLMIPMVLLIGWFSISLETQLFFGMYVLLLGISEKYMMNLRLKGESL